MEKNFGRDAKKMISARARESSTGAAVVPRWMVYAKEKVRPVLEAEASRRPKGPSRTYEYTLQTSYEKAVREFGYEGTSADWFYLLKYAQFPGDGPNPAVVNDVRQRSFQRVTDAAKRFEQGRR